MWIQRRLNKYGAKSTEYNGNVYHSKLEAGYAMELDLLLRGKAIRGWKRQVRIPLDVNGHHIANYVMDFVVDELDGTERWVEVKGFQTDMWRMKWKLLLALYEEKPNVKIELVKP